MKNHLLNILTCCLLASPLSALILPTPNLGLFEKALQGCDKQTLVLFDVGDTLLIPKDLILRTSSEPLFNKYANKALTNAAVVAPDKYPKNYFKGQVLSQMQYEVVDPRIVSLVHSIQAEGIKALAFTKMATGPCGSISSLEDWNIDLLKKHALDFSQAFPLSPELEISDPVTDSTILFKKGVLFVTPEQEKGAVLVAFLEQLELKPSRVLFIDNKFDYLRSVEEALKELGIEFVGFHYTAAEDRPCPVDKAVAKFQLMHLATTGIWLSDSDAAMAMKIDQRTAQHVDLPDASAT